LHGKRDWLILIAIMVLYCALFMTLEYRRYIYLEIWFPHDSAADFQTMWSVLYGNFFTSSIHDYLKAAPHNVLGDQLCFTLMLYIPFWLIFKTPVVFLAAQVLIMATAAIPLFLLARDRLKWNGVALVLAGTFLFNSINYGTYLRFGFRAETIQIPLLLWAFLFIKRGFLGRAMPFLALTLLTKHDSVITLFMIGIYLMFQKSKGRYYGAALMLVSLIYFFGAVLPLFHAFAPDPGKYFKGFEELGADPGEFVKNMIIHPWLFFQAMSLRKLLFFENALVPVLFLCLLSPSFYIALPLVLMNLVSRDFRSVYAVWHWSLVIPFIYIGAIDTLQKIKTRIQPDRMKSMKLLLVAAVTIVCIIEFKDLASAFNLESRYYYKNKGIDTRAMIDALKVIPKDASVSTTHRMVWWLAFRKNVFINTEKLHLDADYVVISRPLHVSGQRITDWKLIPMVKDPQSPLYKDFDRIVNLPYLQIYKKKLTTIPQ